MKPYERAINIALDKATGEIVKADDVFDSSVHSFETRKLYNRQDLVLSCCECYQDLVVSTSKYDRLHFKHKVHQDDCILKNGSLSPGDNEIFYQILYGKESERHKELKNLIAQRLLKTKGVNPDSIWIDDKCIVKEDGRRRPDVHCMYYDKELVFEIQLSKLSQRYILSRYDFYKKHGIYLIWILDNFDVEDQDTHVRDIKYLTKYQNFFKLDETTEEFKLHCEYKIAYLNKENDVRSNWRQKSISLEQIKFDTLDHQIYYYNYGDNLAWANKRKKQIELDVRTEKYRIEWEKVERERKEAQIRKEKIARNKVNELILSLKEERKRKGGGSYYGIKQQLVQLDTLETKILNEELKLKTEYGKDGPPLNRWIKNATKQQIDFIELLLSVSEIEMEVNGQDENGITALQEIYLNVHLPEKYKLVRLLFLKGYKMSESDKVFLQNSCNADTHKIADSVIYELANKIPDQYLRREVFQHRTLLQIIESARRGKFIGCDYQPGKWLSFANNVINLHQEYWEYIEHVFKSTGLWNTIVEQDKRKGTFSKKVKEFYQIMPKQKFDFDAVFRCLYPELEVEIEFSYDDIMWG